MSKLKDGYEVWWLDSDELDVVGLVDPVERGSFPDYERAVAEAQRIHKIEGGAVMIQHGVDIIWDTEEGWQGGLH